METATRRTNRSMRGRPKRPLAASLRHMPASHAASDR